jgi:hypothetical protein
MQRLTAVQREAEWMLKLDEYPNVHRLHAFVRDCRYLRPTLLPAVLQTQFLKLSTYTKQFSPEARQELQWWLDEPRKWLNLSRVQIISEPNLEIYTDASNSGWGAVLYPGDRKASGGFIASNRTSNWRELHAIGMAIRAFSVHGPREVLIKTDSVTAAAYINKEGGPVSHLVAECKHILMDIVWPKGLHLRAMHVAGETNIIADRLSRSKIYCQS